MDVLIGIHSIVSYSPLSLSTIAKRDVDGNLLDVESPGEMHQQGSGVEGSRIG